jgi:predicted transcriptional regulator
MRDMADPVRSAKEAVVEIVSGMPDDSTYDEIVQELVFNRMVARGLADADAGRVISDEEMKRTIDSWRA